jgi:hypothetical protein
MSLRRCPLKRLILLCPWVLFVFLAFFSLCSPHASATCSTYSPISYVGSTPVRAGTVPIPLQPDPNVKNLLTNYCHGANNLATLTYQFWADNICPNYGPCITGIAPAACDGYLLVWNGQMDPSNNDPIMDCFCLTCSGAYDCNTYDFNCNGIPDCQDPNPVTFPPPPSKGCFNDNTNTEYDNKQAKTQDTSASGGG